MKPMTLAVVMGHSGTTFSHIVPWNLVAAVLAPTIGLNVGEWAGYAVAAYLAPVGAFAAILVMRRLSGADDGGDSAIPPTNDELVDRARLA